MEVDGERLHWLHGGALEHPERKPRPMRVAERLHGARVVQLKGQADAVAGRMLPGVLLARGRLELQRPLDDLDSQLGVGLDTESHLHAGVLLDLARLGSKGHVELIESAHQGRELRVKGNVEDVVTKRRRSECSRRAEQVVKHAVEGRGEGAEVRKRACGNHWSVVHVRRRGRHEHGQHQRPKHCWSGAWMVRMRLDWSGRVLRLRRHHVNEWAAPPGPLNL
eukprot:scaffold1027_cov116-Isochrysis_galbana.AAC.6